jgi:hypothetical protein
MDLDWDWLALINLSHALPLITLSSGEITRLSYTGQELFIDTNKNGRPDTGDVLEGIVNITQIQGATSGANFSSQLADNELNILGEFDIFAVPEPSTWLLVLLGTGLGLGFRKRRNIPQHLNRIA